MAQPVGFHMVGQQHLICTLKKSLYGLKQSPRQWYKKFDHFMVEHMYTRSQFDHCMWCLDDVSFIYLILYVDDMLIAYQRQVEIDKLKNQLSKAFEMKDLVNPKKILGREI